MLCDAPLADTEHGEDGEDWCDFSSSQVLHSGGSVTTEVETICGATTASSSLDRLSSTESFNQISAESLEDLVTSFDKVVAKCLRTSISLDGIVPAPRIRHLDDLVEEECGNSYFSAFLTPNYLERLANVKWSECRTRALFVDSMHRPHNNTSIKDSSSDVSPKRRIKKPKNRPSSASSLDRDDENRRNSDEESETPSRSETAEVPADGDLHALMVSSVAEADFNEPQPIVSADDVINEIDEMMRAQEEAGEVDPAAYDCDSYFPTGNQLGSTNELTMIDDAVATVDSGYDISMTSSALSVPPNPSSNNQEDANSKPLAGAKFVARSPEHSDEDFVQLFLSETLSEMTIQQLEQHSERLQVAIRKYSDVLVEELASRDEMVDLKETRDHFVGLVLSVQRRVREVSSSSSSSIALNAQLSSDKRRVSPSVTTVIPYNPDAGPLPLDELRVFAKILQAMLDDNPAVPALLTEYILTVLCAKENPRV